MPHFFRVLLGSPGFCIAREECVCVAFAKRVINAHQALRLRWQLTFTMLLKRNQVVSGKKPLPGLASQIILLITQKFSQRGNSLGHKLSADGRRLRKPGDGTGWATGLARGNPLSLANPGGSIRLMPCQRSPPSKCSRFKCLSVVITNLGTSHQVFSIEIQARSQLYL